MGAQDGASGCVHIDEVDIVLGKVRPSTALRACVLLRDRFVVDGMLLVLLKWFASGPRAERAARKTAEWPTSSVGFRPQVRGNRAA